MALVDHPVSLMLNDLAMLLDHLGTLGKYTLDALYSFACIVLGSIEDHHQCD